MKPQKLLPFLLRASLFVMIAGFGAQPSFAQTARASKMNGLALRNDIPIQIESDKVEIRDLEKRAIFTGNVKVSQGTTTLRAGLMIVHYLTEGASVSSGGGDIARIEVSKKVLLSSGLQNASADSGVFDMKTEILVLKGDKVVLSEGKNVFTGCKLTVTMKGGEARLESCGGRVKIQLDPKSRKTK